MGLVFYWYLLIVGRGQACCKTSYNAKDNLPTAKNFQFKMSIVLSLSNLLSIRSHPIRSLDVGDRTS